MKKSLTMRTLSLLLVLCMVLGFAVPVTAAHDQSPGREQALSFQQVDNSAVDTQPLSVAEETETQPKFADTDQVRVSILLDGASTIEAGYSTMDVADNAMAMAYREELVLNQEQITARIQSAIGEELDVRWNLTLAANLISANVMYGQIESIKAVPGVRDVILENRYEPAVVRQEETADPNMATSGEQIGSLVAWANGYTGAGSRIAVIDTGVDTDHQSFSASAFQYSLAHQAGLKDMTAEEYVTGLDLLDKEEIASVLDKLNRQGLDAESLYVNTKIPFGYNYIDADYDITHDNDGQGEHGSHVTGIAAANAYIPQEGGTFTKALTSVLVQGVAPDAQIISMKVFGKNGGAYDSDYMAAIEDAIILGCDSVNLSLGSVAPGFSFSDTYAGMLEELQNTDTVVVTSASNNAGWATNDMAANDMNIGYLRGDEVSFNTVGSPGSYFNTLAVASVDNAGTTGYYFQFGDEMVFYTEYLTLWRVQSILTLVGEQEYIFIDGFGSEEDFAAVSDVLEGKIAFCSRGTNSFYQKADAAVANGAIATVIYNNQPGIINMDMSGYHYYAPAVSITQEDGARVRKLSTPVTDEAGNVRYYTGKMTISSGVASGMWNRPYETISSFSSWGVPGSLILKPEITAPGGSIYSVNGLDQSGTAYETMSGTSMASPQVAGMVALMSQYIQENNLNEKTGLTVRALAQSLLMSTAEALLEEESGNYYSVMRQGAGLANVGDAVCANTYILMDENATYGYADGKVKAELGDDPERVGEYSFSFTLNDLTGKGGEYTLSADFFTQSMFSYNNELYLDTLTMSLPGEVSFTVDGKTFVPTTDHDCDLDNDGDTDADDAQIIINYAAGLVEEIDAKADLDGSGKVTSYDAYLLLTNLETAAFTVPQGGKVQITVNFKLTDSAKAYLDTYYTAGAYVEGFVQVNPMANAEGAMGDVTHSIPVLGFYGNWSDSSMYEDYSYARYMNGEPVTSHTGQHEINTLLVKYPGSAAAFHLFGNPYFPEEGYRPERLALSSRTTIHQYTLSLIRNASALSVLFTDEEGNVLYNCGAANDLISAFYYTNWGMWSDVFMNINISKKLSVAGVQEGDKVNITVVAVPEYYRGETPLDAETIQKLVEDGTLGEGAFLTTTVTVDNTAPEVAFISKDLTTGNLIISAQDNQYLSAVQVYDEAGTELLASVNPNQQEQNEDMNVTVDLTGITLRERCMVVVADYANNKSTYVVEYGGEPEDFSGRMYAFNTDGNRCEKNVWMEIDPAKVYWANKTFNGGTTGLTRMDFVVKAAEYVGGYVFMADDNGNIFVAEHNDWNNYIKVGATGLTGKYKAIYDMAFNYSDNQLYALGYGNVIYTVDLNTGKATKQYTVGIRNPEDSDYTDLYSLAIDGEGNFYAINVSEDDDDAVFLYHWTKDKVVNGAITKLMPVDEDRPLGYYSEYDTAQSLAWDHNTDKLYWANADYKANNSNWLLVVNTSTGRATKANANKNYLNSTSYDARMYDRTEGLYIVPGEAELVPPAKDATGIDISKTEMTIFRGQTSQLKAYLYPWTLEDATVTWSTTDPGVATVDAEGNVKGMSLGTAVITATSNASPELSASCTVTVNELESIALKGLIRDAQGKSYWAEFDTSATEQWTAAGETDVKHQAGGMLEGKLITHDGKYIYATDPESFQTTNLGSIAASWIWSDAIEVPGSPDLMGKTMLGAICSDGQYLELLDPYTGGLSYFDFSQYFETDPMATIVYWGEGTQAARESQIFRIMTESGKMYQIEIWVAAIFVQSSVTYLGDTGLDLTGVASVGAGQYASMIYDADSGYYLLSAYTEGDYANLYAIDPETLDTIDLGNFGQGNHPMVSLYQFERIADLTVRLNTYEAAIYEKEQLQLTADVKPWDADKTVTWASSNESIATVDQNGLVTAVSDGMVNITATSKEVDEEGNPAVGTCVLTVKPLVPVDLDVHAQMETADGKYQWVGFNTANVAEVKVEATTDRKVTAGTGHNGLIYAETENGLVKIDPKNNYTATTPVAESIGENFFDMATAPRMYYEYAYVPGIGSTPALSFGYPVFVGENYTFGIFLEDETFATWNFSQYAGNTNNCLAAICYVGETTLNTAPAHAFVALGTDGNIYKLACSPMSWNAQGEVTMYAGSCNLIGNIGLTFTDRSKLTMTYVKTETQEGYLIADSGISGDSIVYFVDISGGTMRTDIVGRVPGAVNLTALYSDNDMNIAGDTLEANASFAIWDGTATRASSVRHMSEELRKVSYAEPNMEKAPVVEAEDSGAEVKDYAVSLTITEDTAVTNGVYQIGYDPKVMRYTAVSSVSDLTAVKVDSENGIITFAFAGKKSIAAGDAVAVVNFSYRAEYLSTTVSFRALELNDETVTEDDTVFDLTYEVGGHGYRVTDSVEPTCTTGGYKVYTCTKCGSSYREELPALGHFYEAEVTNPTCTTMGYTTYTCTGCQDSYVSDLIDALGHAYEAVVTAPTCTEYGYTTYTCQVCDDSYVSDYVAPVEHSFGDWETVTEPGCDTEGQEQRVCACGAVEYRDIAPVGHSYEAVVTAPTCTTAGYTTYTCTVCGDSYVDDVTDPTEHNYETTVVAPTCTEPGYTRHTCTVCGDSYISDYTAPAGHSFGEWFVTVPATCTTEGEETRMCHCGETETRAIPAYCPTANYTDVPLSAWYHEAVDYVVAGGIMNGVSENTFNPNGITTRAQLVTVLYRLAGEPEVELTTQFTDVAESAWYAEAVSWAYAVEMTTGVTDTLFAPEAPVTREQVVTFFYRYAKATGMDVSIEADLSTFADADSVSAYAVPAMGWAVEKGIITGMDETTLAPGGTCIRAQIAAILMRFVELGQ